MKRNAKSMYQLLLSAAVLACLLPTSAVAGDDNRRVSVGESNGCIPGAMPGTSLI